MSFNKSQVNVGTGPALGLDDVGGTIGNVQLVKQGFGAEGVFTPVSATSPLPTTVQISTGANPSVVASATTDQVILAANANRRGMAIRNGAGSAILYINFGAAASTNSAIRLKPGEVLLDIPASYRGDIHGIWTSVDDSAYITEFVA